MTHDDPALEAYWRELGQSLGIEVTAPYTFAGRTRTYICIAHVNWFGSERGVLLMPTRAPDFHCDNGFAADAEAAGFAWSFVNVEVYVGRLEQAGKEALTEWGYYGPSDRKPSWL